MMGVIKAKNSAGEWVDVGAAKYSGEFSTAIITAVDQYTFDLSDYVNPHEKFLFFFKSTTNSTVGSTPYVLDAIGDTPRKAHWGDDAQFGWWNHITDVAIADLFPDGWLFEGEWDSETCTLTFPKIGASTYGLLIYIKEA